MFEFDLQLTSTVGRPDNLYVAIARRCLKMKVAAITGAASGIGYAYATTLLKAGGWNVAVLDVKGHPEAADSLSALFGSSAKIVGLHCDVADKEQLRSAFHAVEEMLGPINLLINNAGTAGTWFADAERTVNVNLLGSIRGTELAIHAATAGLTRKAEPPLDIVMTASSHGLVPADSDCIPVYTATKFGIVGLVRALAWMGPRFNVRVTAVCPVTVKTGMVPDSMLSDDMLAFLSAEGRGGVMQPQDCATVLMRILNTPHPELAGEVLTVHPSVMAEGGRVVPLDTNGSTASGASHAGGDREPSLAHLGVWQAAHSTVVMDLVEGTVQAIAKREVDAWSISK